MSLWVWIVIVLTPVAGLAEVPCALRTVSDALAPIPEDALRPKTSPSSFVTYSLEKEGKSELITFYYRPESIPEETWMSQYTPEQRLKILFEMSNNPSRSADIVSTSIKPEFLGEFTREVSSIRGREQVGAVPAYEIKHRAYEVSPKRFLSQVDTIKDELGFSDIHAHVVFEVPRTYSQRSFDSLRLYMKHVNDFSLFHGMEEGLHPNWMTGAMLQRPLRRSFFDFLFSRELPKAKNVKVLSKNLKNVMSSTDKWFSFALRKGIYGEPSSPAHLRLGFELRDFTRKPEAFKKSFMQVANAAAEERWVKFPGSNSAEFTFHAERDRVVADLMKIGLSRDFARELWEANTFVSLPLQRFEGGKYLDYAKGSTFGPSAEQSQRILIAREQYAKDLLDLQKEVETLVLQKKPPSEEELDTVVKFCLSIWAPKAKISELYQWY